MKSRREAKVPLSVETWFLIGAVILFGTALRFYNLATVSLWDGEPFTLLFARYSWNELLSSVGEFSAHPPLWFIVTKLAIAPGWNEWLLRLPAAVSGVLAIPAIFVLGKRLFDLRVGMYAAFLLAISPLAVIFSQNARMYALFVLLFTLFLYTGWRAKTENRARWWIAFALVATLGLYTHYLFVLPLIGVIFIIGVDVLWEARRHSSEGKPFLRGLLGAARGLLLSLVAIFILYLPWLPTVGHAFISRQLERETAADSGDVTPLSLAEAPHLLKDFSGSNSWGLLLFGALFIVGIVWAWRNGKRRQLAFILITVLLPIAAMVLLAPRRLPSKYLIYVLPVYLLLVAQGLDALVSLAQTHLLTRLPYARREYATGGVIVIALVIVAGANLPNLSYVNGTATVFYGAGWSVVEDWAPWREAARAVMAAAPGDFILFPERRALTSRSVLPYLDAAHQYKRDALAPTETSVADMWWIGEDEDLRAKDAPALAESEAQSFGPIHVVHAARPARFVEVLLPNAGFEHGAEGWNQTRKAASFTRDETVHAEGAASLRMTPTRAEEVTLEGGKFEVAPSKLYRATAAVRAPIEGFYTLSPELRVSFFDANGKFIRRGRSPTLVRGGENDWETQIVDGAVPADAAQAQVEILLRAYAKDFDRTSWVDDVRVWVEQ